MAKQVAFDVDGSEVVFEVTGQSGSEVFAASGEDALTRAEKPFDKAIGMLRSLSTKFADALNGKHVKEAEISLGLKVTAKGDFIVVGSSGEASLNIKVKITPQET